jgi:putative SOS response-associated peptidase YedK
MASSSGEQLEARVANNPMRYERWLSLRSGRAVGELKKPETGEWERTFAVITVPSNELVGQIDDRMPESLSPRAMFAGWD